MSAFRHPTAPEPSRAKSGWMHNDRMPQGEVTLNTQVNPKLLDARQRVARKFQDPRLRLGSAENADQVSIYPAELMFTYRGDSQMGGVSFAGEPTVYGFTSFNGVPTFGRSQADFESGFQFIGQAKGTYNFGDPNQPHNGVAVRTRGSGTTWNTGTHPIMVGDRIVWRLPSVDPEQRERERRTLPRMQGVPPSKFLAIIEPENLRG